MSAIKVAILGAGGHAREVWWALRDARAHDSRLMFDPVMFVDRNAHTGLLKGLPVRTLDDVPPDVLLICGIGGMTDIKERIVIAAVRDGHRFAPAAIAESARVGPDVRIGEGTILCAGVIATTDIEIGAHVAVNRNSTIGHDAIVGAYTTMSPGCHVSGCVHIGRNAFLGTGASVIEHVVIGEHVVLGAGAVATKDIPDYAMAVGVPAVVKTFRNSTVSASTTISSAAQ